jgi:hypothetical protein
MAAPRTALNTENGTQAAPELNGEVFCTLRDAQVFMDWGRVYYRRSGRTARLDIDHPQLNSSYSERHYQ